MTVLPPKLIIFDCDGVLVDTEVIANRQIAAVLSKLGPPITGHQCRQLFQGKTMLAAAIPFDDIRLVAGLVGIAA